MTIELIEKLKQQTELPVIVAPMFLVSSPQMVVEACKSGVVGTFPTLNARTVEQLETWMVQIKEELHQVKVSNPRQIVSPWGVNLIVHQTNKRLHTDLQLVAKIQPPLVITSLGDPTPVVECVHGYGGYVLTDVTTIEHARKAIQKGVDGLILVCHGAGGHAGTFHPFAFLAEVKRFWNGLTILAGSISTGQDVLAAKAVGADFAYMGTQFIATSESFAPKDYQEMLIHASLNDLIYTDAFTGIGANYLASSLVKAGIDPKQLQRKERVDLSELSSTKAKAWKDIWSAGQGVGSIQEILSTQEVIKKLTIEYQEALQKLVE